MSEKPFTIEAIGLIHSDLTDLAQAPRQGDEGGYEAWLDLKPEYGAALAGISAGDELIVLTWLHRAQRDLLQVHPRGDPERPLTGVFATRSSHRPNPIGLHRVKVLQVQGSRLQVAPLEAIDGTPIVDLKPVIGAVEER
jgi:tRNA-Thr(GGU) m(6)t(6)A37 methyltransferase TsaA